MSAVPPDTTRPEVPAEPPSSTAELTAVAVAALVADTALWAGALDAYPLPGGTPAAVAGHIALCALLALWIRHVHRRGIDLRLPGLLALTTPFLGPLGPFFVLVTTALHAVFRRYASGFHEWYLSLFPESEMAPAHELYELIVAGREQAQAAASESFTDVMTMGTAPQKQAVIALVARHFRPAFTPALRLGLADADPSVRVQAATATARVEHDFNQRWQALDHAAEKADTVPARYALAYHLDAYAFCGLLDANRELELREKALVGYRRCFALAPQDDDVRHDLGRLLLRLGLVDEAAATLEPLARTVADRRILLWYAEALFRLGRFEALRVLCRDRGDLMGGGVTEGTSVPDPMASVIELWMTPAHTPATAAVPA